LNRGLNQDTPLPVLAEEARRLDNIARESTRNALRVGMRVGDILTWIKGRVGSGKWKEYREEHFPNIPERTDVLYRRLAAYRPRIEQKLEKNPELPLREAVRLISNAKPPRPKQPKPPALNHWRALDTAGKAAGLEQDGLDHFLEYMPAAWRKELADRISAVSAKPTAAASTDKALVLARSALALLKNETSNNVDNVRRKLTLIINQCTPAHAGEPAATVH
jgi:hypothetical protein